MEENYINFFNESLKGNIIEEKYLPYRDYIMRLIENYSNTASFLNSNPLLEVIQFTQYLLSLFDLIIKDNNCDIDYLDKSIEYVISSKLNGKNVISLLEILLFKDKYLGEYNYFECLENIIIRYDILLNNRIDHPFADIMKRYFHYLSIHIEDLSKELERRTFYKRLAPNIISVFYLTNEDISLLDKALNNLSSNFEELKDYLSLNISDYSKGHCLIARINASKIILNDDIYQKKEIK